MRLILEKSAFQPLLAAKMAWVLVNKLNQTLSETQMSSGTFAF